MNSMAGIDILDGGALFLPILAGLMWGGSYLSRRFPETSLRSALVGLLFLLVAVPTLFLIALVSECTIFGDCL